MIASETNFAWSHLTFRCPAISAVLVGILWLGSVCCAGEPPFRTDGGDEKLPWYQIVSGQFPPSGSAHAFAGELIAMDAVNRRATLRTDRTDAQRRSHWDLPVEITMLPYATLFRHGAPAAMMDCPLGTHVHGLFYERAPDEPPTKTIFHNRASIEADFTRCLQLEDDFSHDSRTGHLWRVDAVDLKNNTMVATRVRTTEVSSDGLTDDSNEDRSKTFDLRKSTRVWTDDRLVDIKAIKPGQSVLMNLTWATLYGPGRCTDIWLDEASRNAATERQRWRHIEYQRDRGLAGWIDAVDNTTRELSITLFGGVDDSLLDDLKENTKVGLAVAESSLRIYDQVNDRKSGPLLGITKTTSAPGSSGVRINCRPDLLLEGFRPGRIVRVFPEGWKVIALPQEEQLWPMRD